MKKTTIYRRPMDENLFEEDLTIEALSAMGNRSSTAPVSASFLGIHTVDEIPDEKTVWHVKNILSKAGTFDALFDKFRSYLDSKGLSFNEGKIIDASFVEAPKQRNTREENSDMCKSTNTSRSLLPLWDSRVLTSNNQVR